MVSAECARAVVRAGVACVCTDQPLTPPCLGKGTPFWRTHNWQNLPQKKRQAPQLKARCLRRALAMTVSSLRTSGELSSALSSAGSSLVVIDYSVRRSAARARGCAPSPPLGLFLAACPARAVADPRRFPAPPRTAGHLVRPLQGS